MLIARVAFAVSLCFSMEMHSTCHSSLGISAGSQQGVFVLCFGSKVCLCSQKFVLKVWCFNYIHACVKGDLIGSAKQDVLVFISGSFWIETGLLRLICTTNISIVLMLYMLQVCRHLPPSPSLLVCILYLILIVVVYIRSPFILFIYLCKSTHAHAIPPYNSDEYKVNQEQEN